ncbi:hypothetical protein DM860_012378 [Cuscuta australis]|uniref:Uncharacterized protein n=1 Tax=Cuscuta australis TaxID=267555 RepID=A0A328DUM5_9ASTE|nr:hypothetical protein DM860_012378 [Cuscuta australis]
MPDARESAENASFIFRRHTFIKDCVDCPSRTPSLKKSVTNTFTATPDYVSMELKRVQRQPPEASYSNVRHLIRKLRSGAKHPYGFWAAVRGGIWG